MMDKTNPYYDYAVPLKSDALEMKEICDELYNLGYRTIAVEEVCNFDNLEPKVTNGCGKRSDEVVFPRPADLQWLKEEFKDKLRILQRLTITYRDTRIAKSMPNSMDLIKYDILAARPMTDDALVHACTTFEGDLISFDLEEDGPKLYRKYYGLAQQRNVLFELRYAPIISSEKCRRNSIKFAYILGTRSSSKPKIILSSGASDPFHLRSPADIMFMVNILGLSESEGKKAINQTGQELFLQCASRRIGKTPMYTKSTGTWQISNSLDASEPNEQEPKEKDTDEDSKEDSAAEFMKTFALGKTKKKKNRPKRKKKGTLMEIQPTEQDSKHSSKRPRSSDPESQSLTKDSEENTEKTILMSSLKLTNRLIKNESKRNKPN